MASTTVTADSQSPATKAEYDPIQMLRDFLKDNPGAPGYLSNYLVNRMGDQIIWYDKKSAFFKRQWERYRKIIIILSASIPFLVGLIGMNFGGKPEPNFDLALKLIVGTAGVVIAVLEGFNALFKSQELYVDYRITCEQLRQEFSYFLGKSGDYDGLADDASYSKLIAKAEVIMANQNNRWVEIARQKEKAELTDDIQNAMKAFLEKYNLAPVPKVIPPNEENPTPPEPKVNPEPAPEPPAGNGGEGNPG
jgi:hypothetical protein